MKIKRLETDLGEALKRIKEKESVIIERDSVISQRDTRIVTLEKEIQRLHDLAGSNGQQASELQKDLADTKAKLGEALD
jgi:predicted  nucleic acid-binding Zn-ribbon protein